MSTLRSAWMQSKHYQLTLPFNGFYANNDGSDALTTALLANKAAFRWLNHGWEHIYQGCLQNTAVTPWVCQLDGSNQIVWTSTSAIHERDQHQHQRRQERPRSDLRRS